MLKPGEKLSHYKIISAIGTGGMGEVFLAEDTKLDRQVAVKVLLADVASDDERVRRFEQEARAASALNHPNILTVFEIGNFDGSHYIATEFIKGRTLREQMHGKPMALRQAFDIILQVTAALGAAHEAGIIHRDIKPENVMLREDGLIKVLDFGLAKLTSASPASVNTTLPQIITEPGMLVGTVAYMSPEQARGHQLDPRSDVFSLGIMMFELFTGRRPFEGDSHLDLISSILKDDAPTLRTVAPDLPRRLERIVEKTLRKDRNQRYQHIRDLQIDIEDLRNELDFEDKLNRSSDTIVMHRSQVTGDGTVETGVIKPRLTESVSIRRFTLLHAVFFAFAVIGLAAGVWFFVPDMTASTPTPGSYKSTEVATWNSAPGELFSTASFSPDGKMIAFASTKSGTKNIWVTQTGSTEAIQITNDGFANTDPIWSPKGDEIAYFSDRSGGGKASESTSGIWRVGALGGTPRLIGTIADRNAALRRWSATGKVYYALNSELYSLDIATGNSQKFLSLGRNEVSLLDIDADEKTIVYAVRNDDKWRILTRSVTDEKDVELAAGTGRVDSIAWLDDRTRLFYSASVNNVIQVFVSDGGSGRVSQLTASETDTSLVDAAPDGGSVLTSSAKEESNLWRVDLTDRVESPIARDLNAKLWPAVSPDNSKIAFQSIKNLSQGNHLFDGSIVVKPAKQLDEGDGPILIAEQGYLPVWAPDGSAIAFAREVSGTRNLIVVNPNGGGQRQLTNGGITRLGYSVSPYNTNNANPFSWSPDGRSIAFLSDQNGTSNVWIVNVPDGSTRQLTQNTDAKTFYYSPLWSGDGKRIAIAFQKTGDSDGVPPLRGLIAVSTETGESTQVYETTRLNRLVGWTADESGLVIAEPSRLSSLPPETSLIRIEISDGTESSIANLKNVYFYNIFLSSDRKSIAFAARNDSRDDLWVIPAMGGQARKVTSNNDSALYYSRLAWFNDGSAITFGKQTRFSLLSMIIGID